MLCVVRTFDDVSLLKDDTGKGGWVNLVDDRAAKCRAQLLRDDTDDRLIVVFKQKAPENKVLDTCHILCTKHCYMA